VANDRVIPANGTSPRQEAQRDHPESPLSSASGGAIKSITAGVKAAADRRRQSFDLRPAFTLPGKSVSNEKRILLSGFGRDPTQIRTLAGFLAFRGNFTPNGPSSYCRAPSQPGSHAGMPLKAEQYVVGQVDIDAGCGNAKRSVSVLLGITVLALFGAACNASRSDDRATVRVTLSSGCGVV